MSFAKGSTSRVRPLEGVQNGKGLQGEAKRRRLLSPPARDAGLFDGSDADDGCATPPRESQSRAPRITSSDASATARAERVARWVQADASSALARIPSPTIEQAHDTHSRESNSNEIQDDTLQAKHDARCGTRRGSTRPWQHQQPAVTPVAAPAVTTAV